MSKIDFVKTQVPDNFARALNAQGYLFSASYADMIAWTSFAAVGDILRGIKALDKPAAFVFRDNVGQLVVAAIVKHIPSEDAEHPEGNWSYVWTFDPEDITEDMTIAEFSNEMNQKAFVLRAGDKWGIDYLPGSLTTVHTTLFQIIKEWLIANAKDDEETEMELTIDGAGVFLARSAKEDGEAVISIEPLGKMVQLIKDDAELEF